MTTTTQIPTNGQMRKTLASQLDRMDQMLDGLSEGLNEAVAAAVQAAVGQAVRAAVQEALREVLANPELRRRLTNGGEAVAPPPAPPTPPKGADAGAAADPPRPNQAVAPAPSGGVFGAVWRAWSWACGAVAGAALSVYRPVAHAAREGWRAAALLPGLLWGWRTPALEGLCAAGALSVLVPLTWPAAAAAGGWLAGAACTLAHATMGLLA
jgi:hypothetical protein